MRELRGRSPRDVDPLSWFTGPLVPFVFGGLTTVYAFGITVLASRRDVSLWLELGAVITMSAGFLVIAYLTASRRAGSALVLATVPVAFGFLGLAVSTVARQGSADPIELWWAPVGLGFLIAALAPYLSAVRVLVVGVASTFAMVVATGTVLVGAHPAYWPPSVQLMLGAGSVAVATAASTVFSHQVVKRTTAWAASATGAVLSSGVLGEAAKRRILREELASVGERAVPLLERVAHAGIVTPDDREEARVLAESLRAELVERSNRSWLDSLARRMNLTVVDQDHRADRMSPAQRSALLGLLRAATDGMTPNPTPLLIELRGKADGSTAVALSTDVTFPEGRRLTLLAPHYVSLRATVDELEWDPGERLRLRFRLPPEKQQRPKA